MKLLSSKRSLASNAKTHSNSAYDLNKNRPVVKGDKDSKSASANPYDLSDAGFKNNGRNRYLK